MGLVTAGTAAAVQASPALTAPSSPAATKAQASKSADAYVASHPSVVHASSGEAFVQHPVISSGGMHYVPYDRTYKGLPVVGGDFVVVTDAAGNTKYTSVAQTKSIGSLSTIPDAQPGRPPRRSPGASSSRSAPSKAPASSSTRSTTPPPPWPGRPRSAAPAPRATAA